MPGPYILVVSSGVLANSSDVFGILDPDSGGASTFTVPLSANGQLPASDWACRTHLKAETHNALTSMNTTQFKAYVDQVAASYTPPRTTVGSVTAFKNNVRISALGADPSAYLASLGLQRIESAG